jgi:hypothetical protein
MSLIVSMRVAAGDIVLVADRRGTHGDPRGLVQLDEQCTKLHDYSPGVAIGIVGMPGVVFPAIQHARATLVAGNAGMAAGGPQPDSLTILRESLREHYINNFGLRPFVTEKNIIDARPGATLVYSDRATGRLALLPSEINFTPVDDGRPYAMAGVTQYAMYLYQRLWRDDLNTNEAVRLGLFLVTETSRLDPKVGPDCDVMILTASVERGVDARTNRTHSR